MHAPLRPAVLLLSLGLVVNAAIAGKDWAEFRGGTGGNTPELEHPATWSATAGSTENIAWSTAIPGTGWSAPIVLGDRVFVTSADYPGQERPKDYSSGIESLRSNRGKSPEVEVSFLLSALDLETGKILFTKKVARRIPPHPIHVSNTYATETPAHDGKRVFAYFGAIGLLAAFEPDGSPSWRVELGQQRVGKNFGSGSSIAVGSGHVFVQRDNDESSFLVALDSSSGGEVWRRPRDVRSSWSTPLVWKHAKRDELVACGTGSVVSYDPLDGEILWSVTGIDSDFRASPTFDGERVYVGSNGRSSSGPLIAIRSDASGTLDSSATPAPEGLAWSLTGVGPGMASPVQIGGRLFVLRRTILSCFDAGSGKRIYQERLPDAKRFASSLWAAGDRVFALDESGTTFVIDAKGEFRVLGRNKIDDLFWSAPSLAGDALLLRGAARLHCVRAPRASTPRP